MKARVPRLAVWAIALLLALIVFWIFLTGRPVIVGPVVPQIAAGEGHALGLLANGNVYGWGRNEFGQAGFGRTITQWVSPRIFQQRGSDWVKIATGDNHSLGIKSDGSL
jgi:hypothetical protein